MAIRSFRYAKISHSKDFRAKCQMSLSPKSHLWKEAPSLPFQVQPLPKTGNPGPGRRNCKFNPARPAVAPCSFTRLKWAARFRVSARQPLRLDAKLRRAE